MGAGAGATQGVLGDACASVDHKGCVVANDSTRMPEILTVVELEGFFAGVVPDPLEPALGASMSDSHSWRAKKFFLSAYKTTCLWMYMHKISRRP